VHIRVEKNGTTNVPAPPRPTSINKPLRDTLFECISGACCSPTGGFSTTTQDTGSTVHGGDLLLALDGGGRRPSSIPRNLVWQTMQFTSKPYVPLQVGLSAKFTLRPRWLYARARCAQRGHSHLDAQVEMSNFSNPQWSFRYRGWSICWISGRPCANPRCPRGGRCTRRSQFASGQYKGSGSYSGQNIAQPYLVFHATGLTSRGSTN